MSEREEFEKAVEEFKAEWFRIFTLRRLGFASVFFGTALLFAPLYEDAPGVWMLPVLGALGIVSGIYAVLKAPRSTP